MSGTTRRTASRTVAVGAIALATGLLGGHHEAQAKGLLIGFSQATLQSPFYVQLKTGAEAAAKASGDTVIVLDANGDVNKQNNDIQDLVTRGVKVLIVNPVNPDAVAPALSAAADAHIPVMTVDRAIHGDVATYVGRNNEAMGHIVGEELAARLKAAGAKPGAKIIEIQGDAGGTVMAARRDGFNKVVQAAGYRVVMGPYAEYVRSNAVTAMQDLLQANADVKAVYAHNDDMALGALQVLRENNRTDVLVAGVDGLSEAVKDIAGGNQYVATAANDPIRLGAVTIETAQKVAGGQKVQPFIDAGTSLIDKQTVNQYNTDSLFARHN
ncbi:substrate-binding domain-containing protein [Lichenicoccus roseus]|uniref:Substrate-binding domain-containing protein n=1 Tax=Lichenicoccus roseus TaxID=2683649 RepID=A0A5R9J365_9PROT|nr:substrate-binding domain-containing protein [Lichenicoccus roseus]TLU70937.1 substrate-binding domain-containing protein [Lichenicoccus roseus]